MLRLYQLGIKREKQTKRSAFGVHLPIVGSAMERTTSTYLFCVFVCEFSFDAITTHSQWGIYVHKHIVVHCTHSSFDKISSRRSRHVLFFVFNKSTEDKRTPIYSFFFFFFFLHNFVTNDQCVCE